MPAPALLRPELENSKVQVRSVCGRVPGGSYVSDNVTLLYRQTLANTFGVPIEVSVVIRILLGEIKLINGIAAGLAQKQFRDHAVVGCNHGRAPRCEDIRRFVPA